MSDPSSDPDGGGTGGDSPSDGPPVDADDVRHVAALARLDLEEGEVDQFADECAEILESFETLDEVPAVEAEPDLVNVMRDDEVEDCLDRAEALANAPYTEDGYFKGPNVS